MEDKKEEVIQAAKYLLTTWSTMTTVDRNYTELFNWVKFGMRPAIDNIRNSLNKLENERTSRDT